MKLEYAVEPLDERLIEEMKTGQERYCEEVAGPFHCFPADPDWRTYRIAQERNMLRVIAARDQGILRGVAVSVIGPHPHYACISASLPLLYVDPEYRRSTAGVALVRMAERESEKAGAQLIMTHGGMHNGVYRLFEAMRYSDFGRYFVKQLPGGPHGAAPVFKG
jgi:GNAT superfamily N-acetyltransferase